MNEFLIIICEDLDSTTLIQETLITDGQTTQQNIRTDDVVFDFNISMPSNQGSSELHEGI